MTAAGQLSVIQWLSPAFPTGSFAYSHGLERVMADGTVKTASDLHLWLADTLAFGAGRQDAILLSQSLSADADHAALADLACALAPSAERLAETLDQGTAFARTVSALTGRAIAAAPLPVALGQAAGGLGLDPEQVITLMLHSFLSNLVSVAVRFIPLGQTEGQAVLAALHPLIAQIAAQAALAGPDDIGTCTLRSDLAAMQHETMEVRIFRT